MTDNLTPAPEPVTPAPSYTAATTPAPGTGPKTNVLAIVSFVLGILGFNIITVILAAIALSQIKKTGENGRVFAIIGLVLGIIGIVVWIFVIIAVVAAGAVSGNITYNSN